MMFLLIVTNPLFILFFFPKQWDRNIKWNSLYACFYIVWTHNPGTNSKNTILPFLAKCCKSLLIVPNLLFICFYFQIGNKSKNFRNQFYCNSNWGWGHLSSWRPLSREMLLEFDSWQFQKSLKKSKEFHRRTKHFINSHTQKLISNPLDFTFSIFKKCNHGNRTAEKTR